MTASETAGRSVALADLSYLQSYDEQAAFAQMLLATPVAGKLDAYSSWNTNANTAGTALAEAIAAGAGRRRHTYNELAHRTFTFMRFVDDYAFHDFVRPQLNAALDAQGIADHTLLAPAVAAATAQQDRALLWIKPSEFCRSRSWLSYRRNRYRLAVGPHVRNLTERRIAPNI